MQKIDKLAVIVFIAIFGAFAWMSNEDYKSQVAAEEHAKEIQRIAEQAKKDEFNKLAFEAYEKTGFAARMK